MASSPVGSGGCPSGPVPSRRSLLRAALAGATGVLAAWGRPAGRWAARAAGSSLTSLLDRLPGVPPWLTPNRDFYRVSKNLFDPSVDARSWRLRVGGHVERGFELTYAELRALAGAVDQLTTLSCISNPVGGDLISNARWTGVPLRALLQQARLRPGVVDLRFEAADGYTDSIPLEKALHPETLVAWAMNGEPLPHAHGFPARLVVPGIYGMKHVKWLTRIEAVTEDVLGYWEVRGWSDEAVVRTLSRIDAPRDGATVGPAPIYVAGIAFAGDRGISRVELSADGGHSWHPAEVEPAPNSMTWVRWVWRWQAPRPGRYTLAVRACDGRGIWQDPAQRPPLPDGATGLHRIRVTWRA